MIRMLSRYGLRFLTNRQYRSYVLQLLRERSAPSAKSDFYLSGINDFSSLCGYKIFMCGGCELTFTVDHLRALGLEVYHTFENNRPIEPIVELSDDGSALFSMECNAAIFCQVQNFKAILKKVRTDGTNYSDDERLTDLMDLVAQLRIAIELHNAKLSTPILLYSHYSYSTRYGGVHEYKASGGASCEELKLRYLTELYALSKRFANVYVVDVDSVLETEGKRSTLEFENRNGVFDHPTKTGARLVAEETLYQLSVLNPKGRRIKCAVFDLDNTLWDGVLREDGVANLYPRWYRLTAMQALAARGILLAVCSKNDPQEIPTVAKILGSDVFDLFVSVKLNWKPKSQNIRQIARELNIGIDSIAFFDDNSLEREEVMMNAPGVTIFKDDQIVPALDMTIFEPIGLLTEESASRTEMYKQQAKRAEAESELATTDMATFFKNCHFKLALDRPELESVGRVDELIQRTNQLNATGNRTTSQDLQHYLTNPAKYFVSTATLEDKFGDYGLIGVCIAKKTPRDWEIIEFNLSCRAMGKQVENAMLVHLCKNALREQAATVQLQFKPTDRNSEMQNILKSFGFALSEKKNDKIRFALNMETVTLAYPEWFNIVREF